MDNKGPTEIQLKAAVLNHLVGLGELEANSIVVNELPLGRTSVRADLVTLSQHDHLCGIEIKSDRDSLVRLERQVGVYQEYFDRVIVVVGERHVRRVSIASLDGVEVWVARLHGEIEVLQKGRKSRRRTKTGADLLSQKQAKHICSEGDERATFCNALRTRFRETSNTFWSATEDRQIDATDLRLLSRFEPLRVRALDARAQRESMWTQWVDFFAQNSVQSSSVS